MIDFPELPRSDQRFKSSPYVHGALLMLAERVHATSVEKGFDPPSWDNFLAKTALVYTEVDELVEALRIATGDSSDSEMELADIAIRVMSMLHCLAPEFGGWSDGRILDDEKQMRRFFDPDSVVRPIREHLRGAIKSYRKGNRRDAVLHLELALLETFRVHARLYAPHDLVRAIVEKNTFNRSRPFRHGNQESVG